MAKKKLAIIITAKDDASRVFRGLKVGLTKVNSGLKALAKFAAVAAAALGAFAFVLKKSVDAANTQEKAIAQLNAVLRSTKGVAGLTSKELVSMASAFSKVSTFADEAVLKAEALLLTFTNISKRVFPDTIGVVLDMSASLENDLQGAILQVGKALNDPIKGVSALQEVGVSFTEKQKEQIKVLVESGKTFEAQGIILKELKVEFGGAALAISETFSGSLQQTFNLFGTFQEQIGFSITKSEAWREVLELLKETIEGWTQALKNNDGTMVDFGKTTADVFLSLSETGAKFAKVLSNIGFSVSAVAALTPQLFGGDMNKRAARFADTFEGMGEGAKGLDDAIDSLQKRLAKLGKILVVGPEGVEGLNTQLTKAQQHVLDLQEAVEATGLITQEQLVERAKQLQLAWQAINIEVIAGAKNVELFDANMLRLTELADELRKLGIDVGSAFEEVGVVIKNKVGGGLDFAANLAAQFGATLTRAALQGELTFKKFFKQLLIDLAASIAQAAILATILSSFGGGGFGSIFKGFFGIGGSKGGIVPGFAGGGIVPGVDTGRDTVLAGLRPGELILPPEVTRAIVDAVNRPTATATFNFQGATGLEDLFEDINALVERRGFTLRATETVP